MSCIILRVKNYIWNKSFVSNYIDISVNLILSLAKDNV